MDTPTLYGPAHDVNTTTAGHQMNSDVVALAGGGYVVIWQDSATLNGGWNSSIRAQIYDDFGQPVGGQIDLAIANATTNSFGYPSAVATPDGGFTVVWKSAAQGSGDAITGAHCDAAGAIVGTVFSVSAVAKSAEAAPDIVALGNGEYAVAYVRSDVDGTGHVAVQKIDAAGNKIGGEIMLAQGANAFFDSPAIVALGNGTFGVAYSKSDGLTADVYAAVVGNDGTVLKTTLLTPNMPATQSRPTAVADGQGGFTVMFGDMTPGETEAKGVHLDGNGNVTGPLFAVSDNEQNGNGGTEVEVIALPQGGSFAVWMESYNGTFIAGQMFDANGNKVGAEMVVGSLAPGENIVGKPSLAVLADGRIVVTWHDNSHLGPDADGYAVRTQIIDPRHGVIAGSDTGEVLLGSYEGGASNDVIDAKGGNDKLYGFDGNDTLLGGKGNDTMEGGAGNDSLDGGAGADSMSGGAGNDSYVVDSTSDKVIEAIGGGIDSVASSVSYTLAAGSEIETLTLTGSAKSGTGNEFANTLIGNELTNILTGLGGNDTIDGMGGADMMIGGLGDDTYIFRDAADSVVEKAGEGNDTVIAAESMTLMNGQSIENITLMEGASLALKAGGNELDNKVTGNAFDNTLSGGAGNDTLDGGFGADELKGGADNDTYVLGSANDKVVESAGNGIDTITTTISRDLATYANVENITLMGTADINATGNGSDNTLVGNAGSNVLVGGGGQDVLVGGLGYDLLAGGAAKDVFDFNDVAEIGVYGGSRDRIADFVHGTDIIDLSTIDASTLVGNQKFTFTAQEGTAFTGMKGQLVWDKVDLAGTAHDVTLVSGDINGDKVADFTIELKGLVSLTSADFIL